MTHDEKYFFGNRETLRKPPQIKLPEKLHIFCQLSTTFLKSSFNFKHFEKKDESHTLCISEIIDWEIRAYVNV